MFSQLQAKHRFALHLPRCRARHEKLVDGSVEYPRRILWFLVGILFLAFALRVCRLDAQSIWYDEGLSIYYARQDLPQLLEGTSASDHPPLYFVLLHVWLKMVGVTEFAVRYFSLLWGLLLVPTLYLLGCRLLGRRVSIPASLLLAVSPFHVWYAQEVRMYTLVVFLNTMASLALLSALRHGQRRSWLAYVLLSIAGLYAHFYTAFVCAFQGSFALWLAWRARRWPPLVAVVAAQAATGVVFLPWGQFVMEQIQTNDTYWRGTLALGRAVSWLFRAIAVGETYSGGLATVATVIFVLLALAGGVMAVRRAWSADARLGDGITAAPLDGHPVGAIARDAVSSVAFVLLYIAVPIIFLLVLSFSRPKFAPRYLLSVTPAYYLLVGCGIVLLLEGGRWTECLAGTDKRWRLILRLLGVACLALIVTVSALSLWRHYTDTSLAKPDFRAIGRYIAAHAEELDAVVIVAGHSLPAFTYYNERDLAVYPVPARLLPTVSQPVDRRLVTETLNRALTEGHSRLWLVLWQEELADPRRLVLRYLQRHAHRLGVLETFHGMAILLFEVPLGTQFPVEPPIVHRSAANFDDRLELLGYDLDRDYVSPGDTMRLTLYWQALRLLTENYTAFTHLAGPEERMLGQEDRQLGGDYFPTSRWPVGEVFEEVFPITVHDDVPLGRYPLWTGLYLRQTMVRLPIVGQDGRQETRFLVAEIEIER